MYDAGEGGDGECAKRCLGSSSAPPAVLTENSVPPPPGPGTRASCGPRGSRGRAAARPAGNRGKENADAAAAKKARRVPPVGGGGELKTVIQAPAAERRMLPLRRRGGAGEVAGDAEAARSRPIKVFVRLRPMSREEEEAGSRCCVEIVGETDVCLRLREDAAETDELPQERARGRRLRFDYAFPESATQAQVYATSTADLVEGVLHGRNGIVFCYGATGAGKTYTMLGTMENPGVIVLAIDDLFFKMTQRSHGSNHSVLLSYLEVNNEMVRDLLSPGIPLLLREDKRKQKEVFFLVLLTIEQTRQTMFRNYCSKVVVEYGSMYEGNMVKTVGKLCLVDLAGSETAHASNQHTQRFDEGAHYNYSLLAANSCVDALDGEMHMKFHDSKLIQILKDSLGGSCNTVMIANISSSNISLTETQKTLHWARHAMEIKPKALITVNEDVRISDCRTDQAKLVPEFQKENNELQRKAKTKAYSAGEEETLNVPDSETVQAKPAPELEKESIVAAANNKELQMKVETLEAKIESIDAAAQAQGCGRLLQLKHLANESEIDKEASMQKEQRDVAVSYMGTHISLLPENILQKIFLHLPSFATLVRSACTCRAWHVAVASLEFRRSFCALHQAPLLGLFFNVRHPNRHSFPSFVPTNYHDQDLAAAVRGGDFFLTCMQRQASEAPCWDVVDCRGGYVLLVDWDKNLLAVVNPLMPERRHSINACSMDATFEGHW
ncbi:hypothetical protein ACP4OV_027671 [Aristida adscensionis]